MDSPEVKPRQFLSQIEHSLREDFTSKEVRCEVRQMIKSGLLIKGETVHMCDIMNRGLYYQDGSKALDVAVTLPPDQLELLKKQKRVD